MAKDPAFLFYPNDWIGGTLGMTFEEKGAYMELLMAQFNRGHMTNHMCGQVVGQIWDKIKDKFKKDSNGLWYNERLEAEILKRQNYTKSRLNNRSGKNQYTKNKENDDGHMTSHMSGHTTIHMIGHMENENINTINTLKNTNTDKRKEKEKNEKKEKEKFPEFPLPENIGDIPQIKIQASIEAIYLTKRMRIDEDRIKKMWEVFKIQNLDGKTWYANETKVHRHFINWVKNQNFKTDETTKSGYKVQTPKEEW